MKIILCSPIAAIFISIVLGSDKNSSQVIECVIKISKKNAEKNTLLLSNSQQNLYDYNYVLQNKKTEGLLIYTQNKLDANTVKYLWQFQVFILLVDTVKQFGELLSQLAKSVLWNSRGKFLVAYFGDGDSVGEIFNISWTYFVYNINLVVNKNSSTEIFTFFPYHNGACGQYTEYKLLSQCEGNLDNIFPVKIPFDLKGCEIKLMAYVIPPYVINMKNSKEKPAKSGLEITIIHNVAKRMNLTLNFLKNPYSHWGYRFSDGNFSMMYKALKQREIDIIFGFTYGNSSYSKDFDASFCHLGDASVWFFPTAPQMAQWKNLTNIFEKNLWLVILLILLVNGIAWWFVGRKREPSDDFNDLTICIMHSMYVLLQGSVMGPKTWKVRLMFILWLMTCLLIFTAHQCQLISILTSTLYEPQMTNLEELVSSGNEFGFYPTIAEAYRENTPINNAILKQYQTCPLTAECLNRTAFQRDYAVVKNRRQVLYLMPRYYTFPNGRPMLYDTGISSFTTKERYYMYKGFPLLERFDFFLMLLTSNGLINKWDADTRFFVLKIESDGEPEPLTLNHLQGAFYIYTFGLSFAFTALFCEFGFWKCKQI